MQALTSLEPEARQRLLHNRLRLILSASDTLMSDVPRAWTHGLQHGARLLNMFGQTETTGIVAVYPIPTHGDGPVHVVPLGRPIAQTQIDVLDEHLQPVPDGVPGGLYIRGRGLGRGYLNHPALTAETFLPHPGSPEPGARLYRTGDLGRWLPNGALAFLSRRDHQVKIHGVRIKLGEIEAVLGQHPAVHQAVVMARQDGPGAKRLVAYVVPNAAPVPSRDDLRRFVQQKLPDYMVPAAVVLLDALPLTPNGKVNRQALPAPSPSRDEAAKDVVAPQTPVQEALARLWADVLQVARVSITDNFFELGGDSILSIQIIARAHREGIRITPLQLLQHPTIEALAAVAGTAPAVQAEQGVVTGSLPLTPIMHWFFEQEPPSPHHYN